MFQPSRTVLLALLAISLPARGQEVTDVRVVNFPAEQQVAGTVGVEGHLEAARLVAFEEVLVPPAPPDSPARMTGLGTLDATGFRSVVASLTGAFPAQARGGGTVGLLLVPEVARIQEALKEHGRILLTHRLAAALDPAGAPYLAASSERLALAFPRYRLFLYNTGAAAVEVDAYLYLTD